MRRRDFIQGVAFASTTWPFAARAQQRAMPVIAFLAPVSLNEDQLRGFRQSLKEAGFVEGENVAILYRSGETDRLPALADDLARLRVALIAAIAPPAAFAAQRRRLPRRSLSFSLHRKIR
jgi:putative ABC transport system substrate-binding protein